MAALPVQLSDEVSRAIAARCVRRSGHIHYHDSGIWSNAGVFDLTDGSTTNSVRSGDNNDECYMRIQEAENWRKDGFDISRRAHRCHQKMAQPEWEWFLASRACPRRYCQRSVLIHRQSGYIVRFK
jgi:hypothetical protein